MAVLEPRVPHIGRAAAAKAGQLARHPLSVGVAFADLQQDVRAIARGGKSELFLDQEVLRLAAQPSARGRCAICTRRSEGRLERAQLLDRHAGLSASDTTACAAMPSARPRKPSPSVVVALMLIRSSATSSSRAIAPRIAAR